MKNEYVAESEWIVSRYGRRKAWWIRECRSGACRSECGSRAFALSVEEASDKLPLEVEPRIEAKLRLRIVWNGTLASSLRWAFSAHMASVS